MNVPVEPPREHTTNHVLTVYFLKRSRQIGKKITSMKLKLNKKKIMVAAIGLSVALIAATILLADWDGDGLAGYQELLHGTDMFNPDTDNDGLPDNTEVWGWIVNLGDGYLQTSDPLKSDTNGDGIDDYTKYIWKLDPRKSDTDGDNLSDKFELENRVYYFVENRNIYVAKFEPLLYDTDNDGVYDGLEYRIDIDVDTDKDGLPDLLETEILAKYGANPNRRDIFVEIDKVDSEDVRWLTANEKAALISVFENAPILNPDNSWGVDLHLFEDETVPYIDVFDTYIDNTTGNEIRSSSYDKRRAAFLNYSENYRTYREGFYYGVFTDSGNYSDGYRFSITASYLLENLHGTFAHELGHSLGLFAIIVVDENGFEDYFDGIDSTKYTFDEYPSVMNYNRPSGHYQYSNGGVFNDWEYLENNGFYLRGDRYPGY